MKQRHSRILIFIAAGALLGLLATQIYWFKQAFDLQQKQYSHQINLAIREVGHKLLIHEGDSTSTIPPVQVKDGGEYFLGLGVYFDYDILPNVLEDVFSRHQVYGNYYVMVESCDPVELVLGYAWDAIESAALEPCGSRTRTGTCYNLTIAFEDQSGQLLSKMGIWIFSSIAFGLVLIYFGYSLFLMMREKRLATMRRDFINNMTHELKTPISNIGIAIEQLRKRSALMSKEKQHLYTDIIFQENKRLEQQVERVLQMAMIENSDLELKLEEINIHDLIYDIQKRFGIQQVGGQLSLKLNAQWPIIKADKFHLINVLTNLLDNAQKYANDVPNILIETYDLEDEIQVIITDKGIGISQTDQKRVFEKFYRVPNGDVHKVKGIGLGLSYVKMIVEAHGGRVGVKSRLDQGSSFWFTI